MTNVVTPGLAGTARCTQAPPCPSTGTRSDRRFSDFPGACARGGAGGGYATSSWSRQKKSQYPLGAFPPQGPTQHTAAGGSGNHECPLTPPPPDPPPHALVRHIRQVGGRARPASARTPQKGDANAEHTPQPRPNSERCPGVTGRQCPEPPGLVPRPSPGGRREEHFAMGH